MLQSTARISKKMREIRMTSPVRIMAELELAELEAALEAHGVRALPRPPALPLDLPARRHRLRSDDRPVASLCARGSEADFVVSTPRIVSDETFGRRDAEVRPRARGRPADRVGVHSRHAVDDLLHLDPGRLRDGVRLLPDRQDGPGPQPHGRRDRRPGARARRRDRTPRLPVQHRADGDGRAAAQLRQHDEGAADAPRGARTGGLAAPRHACRRWASCPGSSVWPASR